MLGFLGSLVLIGLLLVAVWWGLIDLGRRRSGWPKTLADLSIALSVASLLVLLPFKPIVAVSMAVFPPVAILWAPILGPFVSGIGAIGFPVALVFLGVSGALAFLLLRFARLSLRLVCIAALGVGGYAGIGAGEWRSRIAMCKTAQAFGVTELQRRSFFFSLRNAPREFQLYAHAGIFSPDQRLAWSYRDMNWYELPQTTWANLSDPGLVFVCDERYRQ